MARRKPIREAFNKSADTLGVSLDAVKELAYTGKYMAVELRMESFQDLQDTYTEIITADPSLVGVLPKPEY